MLYSVIQESKKVNIYMYKKHEKKGVIYKYNITRVFNLKNGSKIKSDEED